MSGEVAITKEPGKAWVTVFAGTSVLLCVGMLYAWSIWKSALVNVDNAGQLMTGLNAGWTYLTNAQAETPYSLCVMIFALFVIPGGHRVPFLVYHPAAELRGILLSKGVKG